RQLVLRGPPVGRTKRRVRGMWSARRGGLRPKTALSRKHFAGLRASPRSWHFRCGDGNRDSPARLLRCGGRENRLAAWNEAVTGGTDERRQGLDCDGLRPGGR